MNTDQLQEIEKSFEQYLDRYRPDGVMHPFIAVKIEHSQRVAAEAHSIAAELGWDAAVCNCSAALGLLHDIGRFAQFEQHGTFSDAQSVDHGEEGYRLARSIGILSSLDPAETTAILDGIRYHNRRLIPPGISKASLPSLKLIRDADKLDILRIVLSHVEEDGFRDLAEMLPNISLALKPSARVVSELRTERNVRVENVSSVGDFLLLQLSWVYDFNYPPTYRHLLKRRMLQQIVAHLEGLDDAERLLAEMLDYAAKAGSRSASGSDSDKQALH